MIINKPVEPTKRIEIIDILRGFALLGIIFMNMSFFSGYVFMPFEELKQISNFQLDEKLYDLLAIIVTGKFYTIFSILFAVGFYIQFTKIKGETVSFLRMYRRRLFILLLIGLIHGLFWSGDILLTYSIFGFILILFRDIKSKNLLRWSIFFLLIQVVIDFALLPFTEALLAINPASTSDALPVVHLSYPDMENEELINTFREGSILEIIKLNIHNIAWKYASYIPSGTNFKFLGIFLLGYYLASIDFFTKNPKSTVLITGTLILGIGITIYAKLLGGSIYEVPTPQNILYKFLSTAGQLIMSISYIMAIIKIARSSMGIKVLRYLIPLGKMALSNYILQSVIMVSIFYSFGLGLYGKIGLTTTFIIAGIIVAAQIFLSIVWLKYFRFGPLEWIWRSLTYKKRIHIRLQKPINTLKYGINES